METSLDKESAEDAELRDKYGSRWNRPASAALNSSMREKIAGYNANLTAAGDSDARLEQRLMQNNAAFSALSIDAAVAQMPRLQVGWLFCTLCLSSCANIVNQPKGYVPQSCKNGLWRLVLCIAILMVLCIYLLLPVIGLLQTCSQLCNMWLADVHFALLATHNTWHVCRHPW